MPRFLFILVLLPLVLWFWTTSKLFKKDKAESNAISGQQEQVEKSDDPQSSDFLRVIYDEQNAYLQTTVTSYERAGKVVDLVGAVHLADPSYYDELNTLFEEYDAVLYEMIGGENLANSIGNSAANREITTQMKMLSGLQKTMQSYLQLESQLAGVDYQKAHFVHADLTMQEFNDLQEERGETVIGFALQQGNQDPTKAARRPNFLKLMKGAWTKNADMVKMQIIETLGAGDEMMGAAGDKENVIIGDRNKKCIEVMEIQIQLVHKIAVFYGAAHMRDLEKRMIGLGYNKVSERWINAWTVNKVKAEGKKGSFWSKK